LGLRELHLFSFSILMFGCPRQRRDSWTVLQIHAPPKMED
jgi:hypothetical protein